MNQKLSTFFEQYWGWLATIFLFLLAVIAGWKNIEWFGKNLRPYLSKEIETTSGGGYLINSLVATEVAFVFFLMIVFFIFSVFLGVLLFIQRKKVYDRLRPKITRLEEELEEVQENAAQIVEQTFKDRKRKELYVCEKVTVTLAIEENGDGRIIENRTMRAADLPVHYWEFETSTDEESPHAKFLKDIRFQLTENKRQSTAVYLPLVNKKRAKKVAIFHLPRIEPGEDQPREIEIRHTWPEMFLPLIRKNKDNTRHELTSKGDVKYFEYIILNHPNLGKLDCTLKIQPTEGTYDLIRMEQAGWPGWRFSMQNAPAEGFLYWFTLKRTP